MFMFECYAGVEITGGEKHIRIVTPRLTADTAEHTTDALLKSVRQLLGGIPAEMIRSLMSNNMPASLVNCNCWLYCLFAGFPITYRWHIPVVLEIPILDGDCDAIVNIRRIFGGLVDSLAFTVDRAGGFQNIGFQEHVTQLGDPVTTTTPNALVLPPGTELPMMYLKPATAKENDATCI